MRKRQRLGQHFLKSQSIAKKIVDSARITKKDVVLEIGTGRGILVPLLCLQSRKVISIESDKQLYVDAKNKFGRISNLTLKHGDGFKTQDSFTVFVSNLPYSESRKAIEWLIQKRFSHAVIMVQKEFAEKLTETDKNHKAISVLANYATNIEHVMNVKKNNFNPTPKVDSVVLKLTKKNTLEKELIRTINKIFSYKRKNLQNILKQFGKKIESDKRLDDLTVGEIISLAKNILK